MKQKVRAILESHLMELGKFNTAWEGVVNTPKLPYQTVWLNVSVSQTNAISDKPLAEDMGFLQITLYYPAGQGTKAIEQRAEDIRQHFYGLSLIDDGVQVIINSPPLIGGIFLNDDKLALPITVYYTAYQLS